MYRIFPDRVTKVASFGTYSQMINTADIGDPPTQIVIWTNDASNARISELKIKRHEGMQQRKFNGEHIVSIRALTSDDHILQSFTQYDPDVEYRVSPRLHEFTFWFSLEDHLMPYSFEIRSKLFERFRVPDMPQEVIDDLRDTLLLPDSYYNHLDRNQALQFNTQFFRSAENDIFGEDTREDNKSACIPQEIQNLCVEFSGVR